MKPVSWETYLDGAGFPLAPIEVQHEVDPTWQPQWADQFCSVFVIAPGTYVQGNEDLEFIDGPRRYGPGLQVFTVNPFRSLECIDMKRPGWKLRLSRWAKP